MGPRWQQASVAEMSAPGEIEICLPRALAQASIFPDLIRGGVSPEDYDRPGPLWSPHGV